MALGSHVGDYRAGSGGGVTNVATVSSGTADASACAAGEFTVLDKKGIQKCAPITDAAPTPLLLRGSQAYPFGTQSAAPTVIVGGADENKVTIGTYTNCSTDTVTVYITDGTNTTATSILTEGTNWTAATSNNATATSLATAINALTGVSATASSAVVGISLDVGYAAVALATSDATCDTVSTGTGAGVRIITPGYGATGQGIEIVTTASNGTIMRNLYDSSGSLCIGRNPASAPGNTALCVSNGGITLSDSAGGYSLVGTTSTPLSINSNQSATATTYGVRLNISNAMTATSGTQTPVGIIATINQASGTAATNMFSIDATTTAVGSGGQNFIRATDDTVQKFAVAFDGTINGAGGLVTSVLEADLTAGACTAGTWKVDTGGATRELCRCNDGGTAYDCISVTTTNGPTN